MHTCHSNARCTDTVGCFNCTCREGFEGDGFICTGMKQAFNASTKCMVTVLCLVADIPECERELDDCDPNANCTNTEGSFTCSCNPGYTGDGVNCTSKLATLCNLHTQ